MVYRGIFIRKNSLEQNLENGIGVADTKRASDEP